jgi:hypothetical protein
MTMASLDEVYGGMYGNKGPRAKLFNSPNRRTESALETHSTVIQELSKTLPISKAGNDGEDNYAPVKFDASPQTKNQREPFGVQNYTPPAIPLTHDYAYQPVHSGRNIEWERRVDKILQRMDRQEMGETSTHDLVMYIFTGVFFLFVLDTFVHIGKRAK